MSRRMGRNSQFKMSVRYCVQVLPRPFFNLSTTKNQTYITLLVFLGDV
jgi:hypothetical protein